MSSTEKEVEGLRARRDELNGEVRRLLREMTAEEEARIESETKRAGQQAQRDEEIRQGIEKLNSIMKQRDAIIEEMNKSGPVTMAIVGAIHDTALNFAAGQQIAPPIVADGEPSLCKLGTLDAALVRARSGLQSSKAVLEPRFREALSFTAPPTPPASDASIKTWLKSSHGSTASSYRSGDHILQDQRNRRDRDK